MAAGDEYYEDLIKIVNDYEGERNTAQNIWYAACEGAHGATVDALTTIASSVAGKIVEEIMPLVSSAITFLGTSVSDWTSADGATGVQTESTAGSLSGDLLPAQVATLVNGITAMRYRGGRERMYFPQPDATKVESDLTWTSAFVTDFTDAIVEVIDDLNDQTIGDDEVTFVLYHRAGNKVVEQGYETVESVYCSPTPGTQRRRVRRVGHIK